jgi:hypothetical protein
MSILAAWQPMAARPGVTLDRHPTVPIHLRRDLRDWIWSASRNPVDCVARVLSRLDLRFSVDEESAEWPHSWDRARLGLAYNTADNRVLEIVDALLDIIPPSRLPEELSRIRRAFSHDHRAQLQKVLAAADSVFQVSPDGRSLMRRPSGVEVAAYQAVCADISATTDTGSADLHLAAAWESLRGRHPDPSKAYGEAIKAVESAAHATIEPQNSRATLGSMRRQLRDYPERYAIAIPGSAGDGDITALTAMISLLWTGQTSRHGSQTVTRQESVTEATMAVHLAVTLVAWFACGGVVRLP